MFWNSRSDFGNTVSSGVIAGTSPQVTAALPPVARGSRPTMSKRARRVAEKYHSALRTYLASLSPGPPGLKNNVPIRRPGSSAGRRATATVICSPRGLDQSTGTIIVPHWTVGASGQVIQSTVDRGGSAAVAVPAYVAGA